MSEIYKQFVNTSFEFEKQIYHVQEVYRKDWKNHIVTSKRRFVYDDEQLIAFLDKISFVETVLPSKANTLNNAISVSETQTITNGLMSVFNELSISNKPTDDLLKKAKAMSGIASVIVNTARLEIEFMKLKKDI